MDVQPKRGKKHLENMISKYLLNEFKNENRIKDNLNESKAGSGKFKKFRTNVKRTL